MTPTASATAPSHPLAGSWSLLRWDISYGDARAPSLPFGEGATGLLLYQGDGWMSACIARANRPPLSSQSARSAAPAERLAAFESYFQYAGRYAVQQVAGSPGRQQVVHRVTHALNPGLVGTEQVRDIAFDGPDKLTLSGTDLVPGTGVERHHRLLWKRLA